MEVDPEALGLKHPSHKLYPFMLAALGENPDVDTSFELLRANVLLTNRAKTSEI